MASDIIRPLVIIIATLLLLPVFFGGSHASSSSFLRNVRSIKDALPKDDEFSKTKAITDMRHKIFALETSVRSMQTSIDSITSQNKELGDSVAEQNTLLLKLDTKLDNLEERMASHGDVLKDLGKMAVDDTSLFVLSNQTCGGVLQGKAGAIVFTSSALAGLVRYPSTCVWTIQTNHWATIKLQTQMTSAYRGYSSMHNAYVVELLKTPSNASLPGAAIQTKITRLQRHMHYLFSGPVVFVVYTLGYQYAEDSSSSSSEIDLHLQFEGIGNFTEKTTLFFHEVLVDNSGNFTNSSLESWGPSVLQQLGDNTNYTLDYTTIVISNFSTKAHLQAVITRCPPGSSFVVISDVLENTTSVTDCCKTSCEGKNALINYDNPFIVLISKKFQESLPFVLDWSTETPYPSTSNRDRQIGISYTYKCGEVLGGVSGVLLYKPHLSYKNNERCIWVIVPQPRPRSLISVSVVGNGVEMAYDHLYMMELTDVTGKPLPDAPRITRLARYGTYEARSRELYIIFYSDSTVIGQGFSLSWRTSGAPVKAVSDVTTRFTILREDDGSAISANNKAVGTNDQKPFFTNNLYEVFLLTPVVPSSYSFGMTLNFNQTFPVPGPDDCLSEGFTVFTAQDGIMTRNDMECKQPGQASIETADGMAVIVMNSTSSSSNMSMSFVWSEEYGKGNKTNLAVENNECGGVIVGANGVLKYKIGLDYLNNERCVWLLNSPNSTSITLKLLKDGFETCCDYILVNTVDPVEGTLRNDTIRINRANRTQTFEESVLVIAFRSDGSTRGRGFALQFTGSGHDPSPQYAYQLRHRNEPSGIFEYPGSDSEGDDHSRQKIVLLASSLKIGLEEDPFTMPTNISFVAGTLKKATGSCDYDSVTFYTTPDITGWLTRERYPNVNDTSAFQQCVTEVEVGPKKNLCSTVFSTFLVVYKLVSPAPGEGRRGINFKYEKSAGCGGIIVGETGEIRYKEDGKYSNGEKCLWLVEVPQAKRIRFLLARSGFEDCCDLLVLTPIDRVLGIPHQSTVISQSNRTATVNGPVVIVGFRSDSSVTGDGFRLLFSLEEATNDTFLNTFILDHRNQPQENQFVFTVGSNSILVMAFSPENHPAVYSYSRADIHVASFRPQVDEQCRSDTLTVYDFFGKERGLSAVESVTALNVLSEDESFRNQTMNGTCDPFSDQQFNPCEVVFGCLDTPRVGSNITVNTTSFIAIYKSVNASGTLRFRGVAVVSSLHR